MMRCSEPIAERLKNRKFVPLTIDFCDWTQVKPLFDDLLNREVTSTESLEEYILDSSGLHAALEEENARTQLATSVNTADEEAKKRFQYFQENILSRSASLSNHINQKLLASPALGHLNKERYGQLVHVLKNQDRLFREENIPLMIQDSQLGENYSAIVGGITAEFEGKIRNLTQIGQFLKETDRDLRERAWKTIANCRLNNRDAIDSIYDEMIHVRHQTALNAGFQNFRDYRHLQYNRFDYTPDDCLKFHDTIEKKAVPVLYERKKVRQEKLKLKTLRPWDMQVDVDGLPPLRPFKTAKALIDTCAEVLDRIFPSLGDNLRLLEKFNNLDLATRNNKAPVGFNMPLSETGVSFIFMNATGTHFDFLVLLHESGHAIETRACAFEPVFLYRNTPQEWGECASQSMEYLGLDHLDVLYNDPETRKRCIIEKLEDTLSSLVMAAKIDAFQHWVYTHPEHTRKMRNDTWMQLSKRFSEGPDYTGLEPYREIAWQGIPHLFIVPFYYIEYGIAQLAALQVYRKVRDEGYPAVERWLNAMKLGYSKSIPQLYDSAGLQFAFHGSFAESLIDFIVEELERLEDR